MTERGAQILRDLAVGLPIPTLLVDVNGHLVWMNGAAAARFGRRADDERMADLLEWARLERDLSGSASEHARSRRPTWLRPEERLTVKPVGADDRRRVLVCIHAPLRGVARAIPCAPGELEGLSPREAEVAVYASRGFTALNIAARLNVAESTVKTHLKRIYKKLGVCSRVELAHRLARR